MHMLTLFAALTDDGQTNLQRDTKSCYCMCNTTPLSRAFVFVVQEVTHSTLAIVALSIRATHSLSDLAYCSHVETIAISRQCSSFDAQSEDVFRALDKSMSGRWQWFRSWMIPFNLSDWTTTLAATETHPIHIAMDAKWQINDRIRGLLSLPMHLHHFWRQQTS